MSYILDALRRADTERENVAVPGLGSPAGLPRSLDTDGSSSIPWRWIGLGLGLGLMVPVAWTIWGRDDPVPDPAVTAAVESPPPHATPAPAPLALQMPPAPAPAPVITPVVRAPSPPLSHEAEAGERERPPLKPAPALNAAVPAKAPVPRPRGDGASPPTQVAQPATLPATAGPQGTPDTAAGATPSGDPKIYALYELPDDVRRSLPSVQVGGSVYSDLPANRILIINGQLFHERDEPSPGLKLEQIKLKGAVLNFRGYRYEIEY